MVSAGAGDLAEIVDRERDAARVVRRRERAKVVHGAAGPQGGVAGDVLAGDLAEVVDVLGGPGTEVGRGVGKGG